MRFADLIAHRGIAERLVRSVEDDRLPHALLFLGPEGNGALPLALALAQYAICEQPTGGDSCGTCPACVKAARFVHPDVHYSYPILTVLSGAKAQQKHKATDYVATWRDALAQDPYHGYADWVQRMAESIGGSNKQGNIPRDECVDIQRKLTLKTFEAKRKVLVVWLPEYLGNEGNRLLKLIEEPPPGTLFLFVAEDADAILDTIRSRTQIVRVPRIPEEDLAAALGARDGAAPETARHVAAVAEGNYRRARQLLESDVQDEEAAFHQWLDLVARWQIMSLNDWIESFSRTGRESQKTWFGYARHVAREAWLHGMVDRGPDDPRIARIAPLIRRAGWAELAEDFGRAQNWVERNANPRIVMMDLAIRTSRRVQETQLARRAAGAATP